MKRILLIAYYFTPRHHIASYRSGCFAKFLPENGWLPTVICEDWPADRGSYDPDFVGRIPPEVEIHRIPTVRSRRPYDRIVLRKLAPYVWPHRTPIRWWQAARARALELIQKHQFDAIWATSDPMTPLAVAEEAAGAAGVPWIADIRDSFNVQPFGSWYKRPLFARQERRLCLKADHVVAVSKGLAEGLGQRIGREITVITNGFDPTLMPEHPPETDSSVFTILYAGTLHRDPLPLFNALQRCLETEAIPRDRIQVVFLGANPELVEQASPGVTRKLPVQVLPAVPHREALRIQMKAAVLLQLAHAGQKGILTGKVFDYLAAGRPILAIPDDEDETSALLKRTGAGVSCNDEDAIVRQLTEWYAAWTANPRFNLERNEGEIAKSSRREQTRRLAQILDGLTAKRT